MQAAEYPDFSALAHEGISEEKTKLTFFRIVIIKELRK